MKNEKHIYRDIFFGITVSLLGFALVTLFGYHRLISSFRATPVSFLKEEREQLRNKIIDESAFETIRSDFNKNRYCAGRQIEFYKNAKLVVIKPIFSRDWFDTNPQTVYILDCNTLSIITVNDELRIVVNELDKKVNSTGQP